MLAGGRSPPAPAGCEQSGAAAASLPRRGAPVNGRLGQTGRLGLASHRTGLRGPGTVPEPSGVGPAVRRSRRGLAEASPGPCDGGSRQPIDRLPPRDQRASPCRPLNTLSLFKTTEIAPSRNPAPRPPAGGVFSAHFPQRSVSSEKTLLTRLEPGTPGLLPSKSTPPPGGPNPGEQRKSPGSAGGFALLPRVRSQADDSNSPGVPGATLGSSVFSHTRCPGGREAQNTPPAGGPKKIPKNFKVLIFGRDPFLGPPQAPPTPKHLEFWELLGGK